MSVCDRLGVRMYCRKTLKVKLLTEQPTEAQNEEEGGSLEKVRHGGLLSL